MHRSSAALGSQTSGIFNSASTGQGTWLEDQLNQLRAAIASKVDTQGLMALQSVVARKADTDDLHRLQALMQNLAGDSG